MILCAWRWDEPRYIGAALFALLWLQRWAGTGTFATSLRQLSVTDWCVVGLLSCASAAIVLSGSELLLHLYPSFVNLGLLVAFGSTLVRGPSMIEKFARMGNPELGAHAVRYTRRVTQMWCVFFTLNGAFSAYTALFWTRAAWSLYNGAIAYGSGSAVCCWPARSHGATWPCCREPRARRRHDRVARCVAGPLGDARTPVCRDGADCSSISPAVRGASAGSRRALLSECRPHMNASALCIDDPLNFASALFALFALAKEPVIPAHAAPGYLADLSNAYDAVLTDADMPALITQPEYVGSSLLIDPHAPLTLYTSGSSGTPKPIRKTLAQFNAEVHTLETQWGALVGDATVLGSVPHHHIYGLLFRVFWLIATGRAFDRACSGWNRVICAAGADRAVRAGILGRGVHAGATIALA